MIVVSPLHARDDTLLPPIPLFLLHANLHLLIAAIEMLHNPHPIALLQHTPDISSVFGLPRYTAHMQQYKRLVQVDY